MAQMTAAERLSKVKAAGVGSHIHDELLSVYIAEVLDELIAGGVSREIAESERAIGCLVVGVNDLWNYSSGGVKHSEYFNRRLVQLSLQKGNEEK